MILLTGGRGFIGTHLAKYLERKGEDVIVYDLVDGFDIRDKFQLDKVIRENNVDAVFHLAALAGVRTSEEFPEEYINTNINGTLNVVRACEKYNIKYLISFSSSSVYGFVEPPNKESQPVDPKSIYAMTKVAAENIVNASPIPSCNVRPFTVYGEDGRKDQVIFKWLNQWKAGLPLSFFGDGQTKRGYTYVGDLVRGVHRCFEEKYEGTLNLGGQEIVTLDRLYEIFNDKLNAVSKNQTDLPKGDVPENWADITKALKVLNWRPTMSFDTKVNELINKHK